MKRADKEYENQSELVKNALLEAHRQWVEQGKPKHIINSEEAQQILGLNSHDELRALLRHLYRHTNLDTLLEVLGLPHKKSGFYD